MEEFRAYYGGETWQQEAERSYLKVDGREALPEVEGGYSFSKPPPTASWFWSLEDLDINFPADGAGRPAHPGKGHPRMRLAFSINIILEDCLTFKDKHGSVIFLVRVCK